MSNVIQILAPFMQRSVDDGLKGSLNTSAMERIMKV